MVSGRIKLSLIVGLLCSTATLKADPLYRPFKSAYYLGRGDTGIAMTENHEAIFYNPAALALGKNLFKEVVLLSPQATISADTKDLARQVLIEKKGDIDTLREHIGRNQHAGLQNFTGLVFRRVAFGAMTSTETDLLVYKDPEQGGLESLSAKASGDQIMTLSIAESFADDALSVGLTGKFLYAARAELQTNVLDAKDYFEQLQDDNILRRGTGTGADFGLLYRFGKKPLFSLGLTAENIGGTKIVPDDDATTIDPIRSTVNVGFAMEYIAYVSSLRLLVDYRDIAGNYEKRFPHKIFIGGELALKKAVGLTGGLYQGYGSAGLYVNLYLLRLDFSTYAAETGSTIGARPDRRYALRLTAGF